MSDDFDVPLGAKAPEPDLTDGIRDVTKPLAESTFDFAAFVAGAKPTRRAVTLYARSDLKAQHDLIGEALDLAERAGDTKKAKALREQAQAVSDEMAAAAVDVVVEGRSDDWLTRFNEALDKEGVKDEVERVMRRVAAQVVAPDGVTYELLEQFREKSEPQVRKVVVAATLANSQPVSVDVPFSRGSSAARSGRGSGKR